MASPLSLTGRRWRLRTDEQFDAAQLVPHLARLRSIDVDETGFLDAIAFLDAPAAIQRIETAVRNGERIGLFGDYDCDGITAVAQLIRMLRRRGIETIVRLPHRVHDGYGLKPKHVDDFADAGVTLLMTADTGITAHAAAKRAQERCVDLIIIDHHEILGALPCAVAILHPARVSGFVDPSPCAAGIVFHFLRALEGQKWEGYDEDCALAMVGTVADLVALRGANRALVREGLGALDRLRGVPLAVLTEHVRSRGQTLSSTDIAFRIAPRINAAGRMADPMLGLRALLDGGDALRELETLNTERQAQTMQCVDHALSRLSFDASSQTPSDPFLCAAAEQYAPGIIGLIAGKLAERFGRPSMAVSIRGDECSASLRSPAHYSIIEGLERCKDLLTSFGGHKQAAGCTFARSTLDVLTRRLCDDVRDRVSAEDLVPTLSVDATIKLRDATLPLIKNLRCLEPFGQENPEPQFLVSGVSLGAVRIVGSDGRHLQAVAGECKVIGFGLGEHITHANRSLDLVCRLGVDTWNGREQAQLQVVDMRIASY